MKALFLSIILVLCVSCIESTSNSSNRYTTETTVKKEEPHATKVTTWGEFLRDNYLCWKPCDVEITDGYDRERKILEVIFRTKDLSTGAITITKYDMPGEGLRVTGNVSLHSNTYSTWFWYVYDGNKRYEYVTYISGHLPKLVRIGVGNNSDLLYYISKY